MFIIISFLLIILTIDTSIVKMSAFTGGFYYFQDFYNILFICIAATFAVMQFVILRVVKDKYRKSIVHKKLKLHDLGKTVEYANYGIISILVAIILEMHLTSSYNIDFILAIIWISYGLALVMLGFLILCSCYPNAFDKCSNNYYFCEY